MSFRHLDEQGNESFIAGGGGGASSWDEMTDKPFEALSEDFTVPESGDDAQKLKLSSSITAKLPTSSPIGKTGYVPTVQDDGSVDWEEPQGGSIEEPTDLEKGIIGGDEYSSTETYGINENKKVCIYNNTIYAAKQNSFSAVEPTITSGWEEYWKVVSISKLTENLEENYIPIDVSYASSVNVSSSRLKAYRKGKDVYFIGRVVFSTALSTTESVILTINNSKDFPDLNTLDHYQMAMGQSGKAGDCRITNEGKLLARIFEGTSSNLMINLHYIANE